MMTTIRKTVLAASCSAFLFLTACNDDDPVPAVQEKFYLSESSYTVGSLANASNIQVMRYLMPNVLGKNAETTAMVMFPKTTRPAGGWPVVVWMHGTTGVGDDCAPSKNQLNSNFSILANSLLEAGYVIVAPDYEGLGAPGIHPYLNLGSEARSAIYAMKAIKERYGPQLNPGWVSIGQSQGGHASLGVAEYAASDANYKGTVATAPASSLGYIITQVAPTAIAGLEQTNGPVVASAVYAELLAYAAYTAVGIKAYEPRFDLGTIFQDRAKFFAEKAEGSTGENGICLTPLIQEFRDDILAYLAENTAKKVMDYPGLKAGFEKDAVVEKFLKDNQPGTKALKKPVYVVQGGRDTAVPYQVTQELVKNLNELGSTPAVILDIVPTAGHTQAIVDKNEDVVAFIKKYLPPQ